MRWPLKNKAIYLLKNLSEQTIYRVLFEITLNWLEIYMAASMNTENYLSGDSS